jgi:hypothetical protein
MQNELTSIEQSTDFLCPNCGASAFEVMGTQWNSENGADTSGEELLIMRCLDCLHLFSYRLEGEETGVVLPECQALDHKDDSAEPPAD